MGCLRKDTATSQGMAKQGMPLLVVTLNADAAWKKKMQALLIKDLVENKNLNDSNYNGPAQEFQMCKLSWLYFLSVVNWIRLGN